MRKVSFMYYNMTKRKKTSRKLTSFYDFDNHESYFRKNLKIKNTHVSIYVNSPCTL